MHRFVRYHVWFVGALAVSGRADAQTTLLTVYGVQSGDQFGRAIESVGDIDHDGLPDFIVGAYLGDLNASDAGYAQVCSGRTGAVLFSVAGTTLAEQMGFSVAGGGDIDGDGTPDFIVGSYAADSSTKVDCGSAIAFSGTDGSVLRSWLGLGNVDHFGYAVAAAGDVDLDGLADVAVGAPFEDPGGTDAGTVRVLSTATGLPVYSLQGVSHFDEFGRTIDSGDFNADGVPDLAVGAWHANPNGFDSGAAYLFSGVNGTLIKQFKGDSAFDFFGIVVSNAFDIDRDGRDDLIVGSHHDDPNGIESGSATVWSSVTGQLLMRFDGEVPDMFFGRSVAGLGDVNGDGFPDLEAGTPFLGNATGINHGLARIYSGKDGALLYQLNEDSPNDFFAFAVVGVGDTDGNGYGDILIGARQDDDTGTNAGSARIYNGCPGYKVKYGTGTTGSGGFTPKLDVQGCVNPSANVGFSVSQGLGGAPFILLFSSGPGTTPLTGSQSLALASPLLAVVPLALGGSGPGAGFLFGTVPLPGNTAGAKVAIQALVADPLAHNGMALTNAVAIEVAP